MGSVPVSIHCLIVPDGGGLCVAEVTRIARVVCRVNQQWLYRERSQIPRLEVGHVSRAERRREREKQKFGVEPSQNQRQFR